MRYLSVLFLATVLLPACTSKILVTKFDGATINEKFFYTLPANTLDLEFKINKEVYTRGGSFTPNCAEFLRIAADSFKLDPVILNKMAATSAYTHFSLATDGISWTEGAIPDTSKVYVFSSKGSGWKDDSFSFSFNRSWMISSATLTSENKTFEIVTNFLSSAVGIVASVFKGGGQHDLSHSSGCDSTVRPLLKARLAYLQFQLHPPALGGEALKMSNDAQLKMLEKLVENLFYKKQQEVSVLRLSLYIPPSFSKDMTMPFCKIDTGNGHLIVNKALQPYILSPLQGTKVTYATPGLTDGDWLSLVTTSDHNSVQAVIKDALQSNTPPGVETGIVYNIPKNIRLTLLDKDDEIVLSNNIPVAQLGSVGVLSQKVSKADFKLDSITGQLTSIATERKSALAGRISATGSLIQAADSAFKKDTELEKLKKESDELELRVKIKEAKAKLE